MPVALRLMRFGKKRYPTYRIVALDKRNKRDGAYIEKVGLYNPMAEPVTIDINEERFQYWEKNGAELSEGLQKLMKYRKHLQKSGNQPKLTPKKKKSTAKKTVKTA